MISIRIRQLIQCMFLSLCAMAFWRYIELIRAASGIPSVKYILLAIISFAAMAWAARNLVDLMHEEALLRSWDEGDTDD